MIRSFILISFDTWNLMKFAPQSFMAVFPGDEVSFFKYYCAILAWLAQHSRAEPTDDDDRDDDDIHQHHRRRMKQKEEPSQRTIRLLSLQVQLAPFCNSHKWYSCLTRRDLYLKYRCTIYDITDTIYIIKRNKLARLTKFNNWITRQSDRLVRWIGTISTCGMKTS